MSRHMGTKQLEETGTPREWLAVASGVGQMVQHWSGRTDLFTMLSPKRLPGGVIAHYIPKLAEVHLNIKQAFGEINPAFIPDLSKRANQYDYAGPVGAAFHEASHARFSTWDLEIASRDLDPKVMDAVMLLEESRIEGLGLKEYPKMRAFMRIFVNKLVMGEIDEKMMKRMTQVGQAAHSCGIVLARVDAGVLKPKDAKQTQAIIEKTLGKDLLAELRKLWVEFQSVKDADADYAKMVRIATEWVNLIEAAGGGEKPEPEEGEEDELSDEQKEELADFFKKLTEAIGEDTEGVGVEAQRELADTETEERAEQELEERREKQEEYDRHKDASKKIFDHKEPTGQSRSRVINRRAPLPEERAAAVTVGRQLDKAKYRDRVKTVGSTKVPPGRLRMRSVLAGEAAKSRGVTADIEPWKRITRHHVDDPNLTVGMMVDISGSMGEAMQPMATAAWVMSEAIRRIQGTAAMVYYGSSVKPALKPGEHLEQVALHTAEDGSEEFDGGFKALDGALNLLHGRGARLLVIVSDGQYTASQAPLCQKWLARCKQAGVAVLWIGYGNTGSSSYRYGGAEQFCEDSGAEFVRPSGDITSDAMLIGRAGEKALSQIGART